MDRDSRKLFRYAAFTALGAGILMTVMVILMHIFPYANMLRYEQIRPVAEYSSDLLQGGLPIRVVATIDHVFLILVLATFILVGQAIKNERNSLVIYLTMVPAVITAYLDIFENHHVISMMVGLLQNIPITQEQINTQAIQSLAKFHGGNIVFFILAFFLPHLTKVEKIFRFILLFVLVPTGVVRYAFQDQMDVTVFPYIPIALGFLFASYVFFRRSQMKDK